MRNTGFQQRREVGFSSMACTGWEISWEFSDWWRSMRPYTEIENDGLHIREFQKSMPIWPSASYRFVFMVRDRPSLPPSL